VLYHGGLDERVNAGIAAYEAALKSNKLITNYIFTKALIMLFITMQHPTGITKLQQN
jgi:hypothetical protein